MREKMVAVASDTINVVANTSLVKITGSPAAMGMNSFTINIFIDKESPGSAY